MIVKYLLWVAVNVRDAHELGTCGVYGSHDGPNRSPLVKSVVVGVIPDDHSAGHGDPHRPGLAAEFAVHLDSDLGSDAHQTLGLVQHRGGDALTRSGLLDDTLLLDCSVMLTLVKYR